MNKQSLFNFAKGIYKKLPGSYQTKARLKGTFYRLFGFAFKDSTSYRVWQNTMKRTSSEEAVKAPEAAGHYEFKGTIGIHLHLYFVDLKEEFCEAFRQIPYPFDLYITTEMNADIEELKKHFGSLKMLQKLTVLPVENRGRDVAPFLVTVGPMMAKHDVICHLHSKKSLYSGGEQTEWRKYLLKSLMGSPNVVREHFYMLMNGDNVGLLYPETYAHIPYIGHTWLQNSESGRELMNKLQLPLQLRDTFVDFPLGTMFWAKGEALRQFFEVKWKVSDFPKENHQTDGTIAHAFERCVGVVSAYNGFHSLIVQENGTYLYDFGQKNLDQYYSKQTDAFRRELSEYEVVSFDVFDTLLSRSIHNHRDIWKLAELRVDAHFRIRSEFARLRGEAEEECRRFHPEIDCSIDDIYNRLQRNGKLSKEILDYAKEAGLQINKSVLSGKESMTDVYQSLIESGKTVYLISDMHLRKEQIEELLTEHQITGYRELLVSSDKNLRKDNGTMWDYYMGILGDRRGIHVGDNPVSDIQIPMDKGFASYHILNASDYLEISNLSGLRNVMNPENLSERIMLGMLEKKLFDQPFRYNENRGRVTFSDSEELGYALLGPLLTGFCLGLRMYAESQQAQNLLFCAREGYLIKQVYDALFSHQNQMTSNYIYVSRRAVLLPTIETEDDIMRALELYFVGSFRSLMEGRFGIRNIADESEVNLPDQKDRIFRKMEPYRAEILRLAKEEKEAFHTYLSDLKLAEGKSVLVDIGYSGTIQYYLSRLTETSYFGYYLATDGTHRGCQAPGNTMTGYYADSEDAPELSENAVLRYAMALECLLIAPDAQLERFDSQGRPRFVSASNTKYTKGMEQVQKGAVLFAKNYRNIIGDCTTSPVPEPKFGQYILERVVRDKLVSEELLELFSVEDNFCDGIMTNAIDFYREQHR